MKAKVLKFFKHMSHVILLLIIIIIIINTAFGVGS